MPASSCDDDRRTRCCRFFYAVSLPLLLGGILYMLWFMPAPDTPMSVKVNVGLAWCAAIPRWLP